MLAVVTGAAVGIETYEAVKGMVDVVFGAFVESCSFV
jgi:hypothetical protein